MNKTIPSIKVPVIQKGITSKVSLSDELKGKNTKGLKGPAYKNYKPEVNN